MDVIDRRLNETRKQVVAAGLDALVCYTNGNHSFLQMDTVWYFSGVKSLGPSMMLLPGDGEPTLLVTPSSDYQRMEDHSWLKQVRATDDLEKAWGELVKAKGIAGKKVGIAGLVKQSKIAHEMLVGPLGGTWLSADALINAMARRRDQYDLALFKKATEIAERAYSDALGELRPGLRECDWVGALDAHLRALGSDDNFLLVSGSQHNLAVHAPTDRRLETGDIILAELSPSFQGQATQICRTAVLGEATPVLQEKYELLKQAMQAGLAAAIPGTTVGEVVRIINEVMSQAGYAKYCFPPYMRVRGHGMGLGCPEPELQLDGKSVLEEGMVFVLHPNQYIPETGYLLCGEPVVITSEGARYLSSKQVSIEIRG